jgi:uncharacterized protein YwqG
MFPVAAVRGVKMFRWIKDRLRSREQVRDVHALAMGLARPSIHLVAAKKPTRSHLGGAATVEIGDRRPSKDGKPLPLIAQLDLQELQEACPVTWLPGFGSLLFYYDHVAQDAWGFDPKDKASFAVVYAEQQASPSAAGGVEETDLSFQAVKCVAKPSFPSADRPQVAALDLNDTETDRWDEDIHQSFRSLPKHQVLGFPSTVQGDGMELECQLVSNGIYCGNSSGLEDPRAAALAPGEKDWRLLLQVDTDEQLGLMWGDCGLIYFWIREQDAAARRFDRAWVILQCS